IGLRIFSFEYQHRQPLPAREEVAGEGAERDHARGRCRDLLRFPDREQLDEEPGKLDDAVVRAPWMAVARPDRKAEARVELPGGVEVAHHVHEMIEPARHQRMIPKSGYRFSEKITRRIKQTCPYLTAENDVGWRNMLVIDATIWPSFSVSARLASHSGSVMKPPN